MLLFQGIVTLFLLSATGIALAESDDRQRYEIVTKYVKSAGPDAQILVGGGGEYAAAAKGYVYKTDSAFRQLKSMGLSDRKVQAYEEHWNGILKPKLQYGASDPLTATKVNVFTDQFEKAAKGGRCTVVVSASKGDGAIVQYAKAHDAELGRSFKELEGTTTVIQEIERAEYIFKCLRNGKETGRSGVVACTDAKAQVKVTIKE